MGPRRVKRGRRGSCSKVNDDKEYTVETIYQHRERGGVHEYFVKWEGYPDSKNSWVPEEDFAAVRVST
jgi:hypothetical protein